MGSKCSAAIGAATEEDGFASLVNAVLSGHGGKVATEITTR